MADRFDKFTERARRALTFAQEEAQRFNHDYLGTEHIMLGLIREGDSTAAVVLGNLGVEPGKIRSAIEFIIGHGEKSPGGEIGLTPRAKKVIELAIAEARRLNHSQIGTEHLLLGLAAEGEGLAFGVLESLGVSLERLRSEATRMLSSSTQASELSFRRTSLLNAERLALEAMQTLESLQETDFTTELSRTLIAPVLKELADALDVLAYRPHERWHRGQATRNIQLLDEATAVFEQHDLDSLASIVRRASDAARDALGPA